MMGDKAPPPMDIYVNIRPMKSFERVMNMAGYSHDEVNFKLKYVSVQEHQKQIIQKRIINNNRT